MANEINLTGKLELRLGRMIDTPSVAARWDWLAYGAKSAPTGLVRATVSVADTGYTSFAPWSTGTAWQTWGTNAYRSAMAVIENLATNDGNTQFGGFATSTPIAQCPLVVLATNDATTVPTNREEVGQYEFMAIPPGAAAFVPLSIYATNLKARAFRFNGSAWVACAAKFRIFALEQ